ncbi:MAG: divalent-cation tolerance protein CutA [Thermodesulfobacteriota bacterium]|nr:divalent-cation tolerance protein CutA [Thermodesulfobacteriota bacterium]
MMENMDKIVIFVTAGSPEEAEKIADLLVKKRKTACANLVPKIHSLFWWCGKIDSSDEVLLIFKSKACLLQDIVSLVKEAHSYDVPEIIALPIIGGNEDYLRWIEEETEG